MARKSSITRLDPEIKAYIEAMLATGSQTLYELIADLRERFPAAANAGSLPSRSAVGRYGQKLERRLSTIRASTEAAKMIRAHAGDNEDARSEALTAMVQTELFEALLNLQEAEDPDLDAGERLSMLSAAAKNIATLTRSSFNLKMYQAKAAEEARRLLLAEQAEKLQALGNKGGITPEAMSEIRHSLGIE